MSVILTDTLYRRPPLGQEGLEIASLVVVEMSPTVKNIQLLNGYIPEISHILRFYS